jgi:xanthine dehydrogenase accessory factor
MQSATDADVFREAGRKAAAREAFVFCIVTLTRRSAPRDSGAKMLVAADGSITGTVGGGPLEGVIIHEARRLLATAAGSRAMHFALDAGGDAATPIEPGSWAGDELGMKCGGEATVFLDVIRPPARVLVYGGGHVGEQVAALAARIGLCTVVIDDREEFANRERFPFATEVRRCDLAHQPLGGISAGPSDFVVIVTRCHAVDEVVLEAALGTRARYVGLIGSRRKIALVLRNIARRTGRDPREDERLHAPIGLRLGDKSPGEVALSILAEVVLIKSAGRLEHARLRVRDVPKPHAELVANTGVREQHNSCGAATQL